LLERESSQASFSGFEPQHTATVSEIFDARITHFF
jgi:hypothetical protein